MNPTTIGTIQIVSGEKYPVPSQVLGVDVHTLEEVYSVAKIYLHRKDVWAVDPDDARNIIRSGKFAILDWGTYHTYRKPEPAMIITGVNKTLTARIVQEHNAALDLERRRRGREEAESLRRRLQDPQVYGINGDEILEAAEKLRAADFDEYDPEGNHPVQAYAAALNHEIANFLENVIKNPEEFIQHDTFDFESKVQDYAKDWARAQKHFPAFKCPQCGGDMMQHAGTDIYVCQSSPKIHNTPLATLESLESLRQP